MHYKVKFNIFVLPIQIQLCFRMSLGCFVDTFGYKVVTLHPSWSGLETEIKDASLTQENKTSHQYSIDLTAT